MSKSQSDQNKQNAAEFFVENIELPDKPNIFSGLENDITSNEESKNQLRRAAKSAQDNLERVLSSISDAFAALDTDFKYLYVNDAATKMSGIRREEFVGKTVWEVFPNLIGTSLEEVFRQAMRERKPSVFEYFYPAWNRWFEYRFYPTDEGLMILIAEITDKKRGQEILERYRLLSENARDIIWLLKPGGQIVEVNDAVVKNYGYSREELLEMNVRDLRAPATLALFDEQLKQAAAAGIVFETVHRRKDGVFFPVEVNSTGGNFGGEDLILSIIRDISERKRAEQQIAGQNRILEALALGKPLEEILHLTTSSIENLLTGSRCSVLLANDDETQLFNGAARSLPAEYNQAIEGITIGEGVGSCGTAAHRRAPIIVSDIARDELWKDFRKLAKMHHLAACWSHPILAPDDRLLGTFAVYFGTPRTASADELALLAAAARVAGIAIERRLTEEAVEKSESQLRRNHETFFNLVKNTPFGTYIVDGDFRLIEISAGAEKVFSNIQPLIGRDFAEILRLIWEEPFATQAIEHFRQTLATGEPYRAQNEEQRADLENTESYDWKIERITLPDDTFGVVCYFYDLTELRQAQENLERAAAADAFRVRLADALRLLSDAAEIQATTGRVLGEWLKVNRVVYFEVRGTNYVVERDYTDDAEPLAGGYPIASFGERLLAAYRRGQTVLSSDVANDTKVPIDERAAYAAIQIGAYIGVPLIKNGEFVAGLAVHSRTQRQWTEEEITLIEEAAERTWAAVERARAEEALSDSKARFDIVKDSAQVGFWFCDLPFDVLEWDNRVKEHFWLPPEATVTIETFYEQLHPDDRERTRQAIDASIANKTRYEIEYRTVAVDGQVKWIRAVGRTFYGSLGSPIRFDGVTLDITAAKKAETERERLLEREQELRRAAETANRLKDEFLATVSHELRTPLNAILGWSTIAQKSETKAEIVRNALQVIERSARNQNQLISDILDVSRIITGKLNLNLQSVCLSELISAAIDTVRPSLNAKKIHLATFFEPDEKVEIEGDADRLQQIIWNLLANAVKFTPENGKIEVALKYLAGTAEIIVTDMGEGIEPEFLPYVFDRFRQADGKKNRRHGGLGLGLAVVRHLTEMHGGSVFAISEGLGQGAAFTIRLPLNVKVLQASGDNRLNTQKVSEIVSQNPTPQKHRLENQKILVLDDQPDAMELARYILTAEGSQVLTAQTVDEALTIIDREVKIDAIISDIGMPEKDGFVLMRELQTRFSRRNISIPTIALTAYAGETDKNQIFEAGFITHLSKPFEAEELVKTVAELIFSNQKI